MEDDGGLVSPEWTPGIRYRQVDVCTFFLWCSKQIRRTEKLALRSNSPEADPDRGLVCGAVAGGAKLHKARGTNLSRNRKAQQGTFGFDLIGKSKTRGGASRKKYRKEKKRRRRKPTAERSCEWSMRRKRNKGGV